MLTDQQILKLTQLFTINTSARFAFMFRAELSSQFVYGIDLEGSPSRAANAVADGFRRLHSVSGDRKLGPHDQAMQDKFVAYIDAQPIPVFIQEYLDKGNR